MSTWVRVFNKKWDLTCFQFNGKLWPLVLLGISLFGCAGDPIRMTSLEIKCPRDELSLSEYGNDSWMATCRGERYKCHNKGINASCWRDLSFSQNVPNESQSAEDLVSKDGQNVKKCERPMRSANTEKKWLNQGSIARLGLIKKTQAKGKTVEADHWNSEKCWKQVQYLMGERLKSSRGVFLPETPFEFDCAGQIYLCMAVKGDSDGLSIKTKCNRVKNKRSRDSAEMTKLLLNFYSM